MASPGRLHGSVNCFQLITVFLLTFINSAFLLLLQPLHPSSSQGPKGFPVAVQNSPGGHHRGFSLQRRIPQVSTQGRGHSSHVTRLLSLAPAPREQHTAATPALMQQDRDKSSSCSPGTFTHRTPWHQPHTQQSAAWHTSATAQAASTQEKGHSTYCAHVSWLTAMVPGAPAEPALLLLHRACRLPALIQPHQQRKVEIKGKRFLPQHQQEALS